MTTEQKDGLLLFLSSLFDQLTTSDGFDIYRLSESAGDDIVHVRVSTGRGATSWNVQRALSLTLLGDQRPAITEGMVGDLLGRLRRPGSAV